MNCTNAAGLRPKGWQEFLFAAAATMPGPAARKVEVRKLIAARDLLTACEVVKERMGEQPFQQFIHNEFLAPQFQPAQIHDSIINLDSRLYATPNFDKIFDTRINHAQANSVLIKNYYDDDIGAITKGVRRVVLKVHGTIDLPQRMIFTRSDYARARNHHRGFYAILEALVLTHTFVFVGCGLNDPDIRLLLEDYAFRFTGAAPHYFVIAKDVLPKAVSSTLERSLNVKFLLYDSSGGHVQLRQAIDECVSKVNAARIGLQTTGQW
jgi:hypothetical protein